MVVASRTGRRPVCQPCGVQLTCVLLLLMSVPAHCMAAAAPVHWPNGSVSCEIILLDDVNDDDTHAAVQPA